MDARGRRLVGLSDPFDAEFKRRLRRTLVVRAQEIAKRPAVFGICVGNEAHIEGNFAGASSSGYVYSEACGREFVRWLRERYGGDGHGARVSKWTLWKSLAPDFLGHRCKLLRRRRPSLTNARYQGARKQALHRLSPIAIWKPHSTRAAPIDRDGTKRALKRSGWQHRRLAPPIS